MNPIKQSLNPNLLNSTLLITGANGGIGFDIVKAALNAGARVLATDLKIDEKLSNLRTEGKLECRIYDLNDDDQQNECLDWANKLRVNVLVNNAAIFDMAPILEADLNQFDRLFSIFLSIKISIFFLKVNITVIWGIQTRNCIK